MEAQITVREDGSVVIELDNGHERSRFVKFAPQSSTARDVAVAVQRAQQHISGDRSDPMNLVVVEPVDSRVCKAYGEHRIATRHTRDECPYQGKKFL